MTKDVAVIGVGQSSFVRSYEGSIRSWLLKLSGKQCKTRHHSEKCRCLGFLSAPEYDKQRSPAVYWQSI